MKIRFWVTLPLIVFSLLYPSIDESLEECALIAEIYMLDEFYDPEYFESLELDEYYEVACLPVRNPDQQ